MFANSTGAASLLPGQIFPHPPAAPSPVRTAEGQKGITLPRVLENTRNWIGRTVVRKPENGNAEILSGGEGTVEGGRQNQFSSAIGASPKANEAATLTREPRHFNPIFIGM
jgi:hypothetical protein